MNSDQKERFRQELADKFCRVLEEKELKWTQEWQSSSGEIPFNAISKTHYNGINELNLRLTSIINGYDDPRWVTMNQIRDSKGTYHPGEKWHLRAGSHGARVEYWYPIDRESKQKITWNQYEKEIKNGRSVNDFLITSKHYVVFNAAQIEGIKPYTPVVNTTKIHADKLIENLSKTMGVPIKENRYGRAFYNPIADEISLPQKESFISSAAYAGTALHELAHATGHSERLNRNILNAFGTEKYAREELVAEMTSCFMAPNLDGVDISAFNNFENNRAYIQSWVKSIKDDPNVLLKAVKDANQATKYLEYKAGIIPEAEYKLNKSLDSFAAKTEVSHEEKLDDLSRKLVDYAEKTDPYEVKDFEDFSGQLHEVTRKDLRDGNIKPYKDYLVESIKELDRAEFRTEAKDILKDLEDVEKMSVSDTKIRIHM